MTKAELIVRALEALENADCFIQEAFTGSDDLYEIYLSINDVADRVRDLAVEKGIEIPE